MGQRTVLVTGATSGIGRVAAERIAASGATVLVAARSRDKGETAVAEIRAATGNGDVHLVLGDFASLADVRSVATQVQDRVDHLDVLLNNAGLLVARREFTVDGHERTLAVNHLAPLLLTHLLLDSLRASPSPRVVTTASSAHQMGELDLDDLRWERRRYTQFRAYGASKLANVLFASESARRWPDIHSVAVHPGSIHTSFGSDGSFWLRTALRYTGAIVLRPVEEGARQLVWAALDDGAGPGAAPNGSYLADLSVKRAARRGRDAVVSAALWEESLRLVDLA